jgi:hypothetical protein
LFKKYWPLGLIIVIITLIIIDVFFNTSEEKIKIIKSNFINTISNSNNIEWITIYNNNPLYRIRIEDANIINELCSKSIVLHEVGDIRFNQEYIIQLRSKDTLHTYTFKFGKMCDEPTACGNYVNYKGKEVKLIDIYNDCGRIALFKNPRMKQRKYFDDEGNIIATFQNVDLIPFLNNIDEIVKRNPEKYKWHIQNELE